MGREVPEIGDEAVREIIVRSYRVVYRVRHPNREVEISRFWHGARRTHEIGGLTGAPRWREMRTLLRYS
jgi:plasmid stabilization system protein ParE